MGFLGPSRGQILPRLDQLQAGLTGELQEAPFRCPSALGDKDQDDLSRDDFGNFWNPLDFVLECHNHVFTFPIPEHCDTLSTCRAVAANDGQVEGTLHAVQRRLSVEAKFART